MTPLRMAPVTIDCGAATATTSSKGGGGNDKIAGGLGVDCLDVIEESGFTDSEKSGQHGNWKASVVTHAATNPFLAQASTYHE